MILFLAAVLTFQDMWMGRVARPPSDGVASVFDDRRLASGHGNPRHDILCAHRTEALGRVLIVTNTRNNKSVACPVRDRGPYRKGRVIDLYPAAARAIGCDGLCNVTVRRKGFE